MTRIIIEIDGKEVSSTTIQPTGSLESPPPELLARATALGAYDAGSAPSEIASLGAAAVALAATDAGPPQEPNVASERAEEPKPKSKPK